MAKAQDNMRIGICADCENKLHHGPWTQEQMQEVADDIGMPVADFRDCCDQCFLAEIASGDVAYAEHLMGRKLDVPATETAVGA